MPVARSSGFLGAARQISVQGTWALSSVALGEAPPDSTALMFLLFMGPTQAGLGARFPVLRSSSVSPDSSHNLTPWDTPVGFDEEPFPLHAAE